MMNLFNRFQEFITGWRFAILMLSVLFFFTLLVLGVVILPTSSGPWASFAEDFKVWCFRYDPATDQMEWAYVIMFLLQPILIGTVIVAVWWRQLQEMASRHSLQFLPYISGGLLVVVLAGGIFSLSFPSDSQAQSELPFPAEKLRTSFRAADFTLINQEGHPISLSDYRGKVVLITAVYTRCGYSCPLILAQAKRVLAQLSEEERKHLNTLIITLDPEHDTPEVLKLLARGQTVSPPLVNFLTGDPFLVNRVLDDFNFSRRRNPETGIIEHSNLFILIDRRGRVAYRFTLGEKQENWLVKALKALIQENEMRS